MEERIVKKEQGVREKNHTRNRKYVEENGKKDTCQKEKIARNIQE